MKHSILITYLIQVLHLSVGRSEMCRSWLGQHTTEREYSLFSYAWCYKYLFFTKISRAFENHPTLVISENGNLLILQEPDFHNKTVHDIICSTLTTDQCLSWASCCNAADACCARQLSTQFKDNSSCERIWDGWGCWDDASPGSLNYESCPIFVPLSLPTRQSVKTCLNNGSWVQQTDYTPCINHNELEISIYIGLGCSIASTVLLLPAIIILLRYKLLRQQHRIRLHINFFVALLLKEIMTILWDMLVVYDKVQNTDVFDTVLVQNGVGCKLLSFFKIYFKSCTFTWMFCEGFYLHRLMSNAFSPPRSLLPVYVAGWTVPLVSCSIYGILRGVLNNESCWSDSFNNLEWIFDVPNVLCLVLNLVFLFNILRILLTQIQSHPNEPGNFRRAVKATFVLIPLFGIQLFVTLYRIPITSKGGLQYERFTLFVNNLQGFVVALIFCFMNGEVISLLRRTWRHRVRDRSSSSRRLNQTVNQTLSTRSDYEITKNGDTTQTALLYNNKPGKKETYQLDEQTSPISNCDKNGVHQISSST